MTVRLTLRMKTALAVLAIYVITLLVEAPMVTLTIMLPQRGVAAAIGPLIAELIFVAFMIAFIAYGMRRARWAYVGALVVGIAHGVLSASIYFRGPNGPPLAIAIYLALVPVLVTITSAWALLDFRRTLT